jgi:hypothetical protein
VATLIDDTEGTNWASLSGDVAGKQVTVRLDPSKVAQGFNRVQVSALLRPINQSDPGGDRATQNHFSALRQFELLGCTGQQDRRLLAGQPVQADLHQCQGRVPGRRGRSRRT